MIYLDNAATTLKKPPCVAEAVVRAMATMGNSGRSAHQEALDASRVIYRTREQLAKLLGCSAAERVVFTCNSTEALNIATDGCSPPVTMCCPLTASTTPCCGPCTGWRGWRWTSCRRIGGAASTTTISAACCGPTHGASSAPMALT